MASDTKKDAAASPSGEQVPVSYAEKAMSSLLRLHDELVEEKERRIDLYRRLMDREQQLAEVRAYVQLLESELGRLGGATDVAPALTPRAQPAPALPRPARDPAQEAAHAMAHDAALAAAFEPVDALEIDEEEPVAATHVPGPSPVVAWVPSNAAKGGRR
ncbi:MAG TPA: hypothetical protein VGD74_06295 [Vulgatibacter sp.]